MLDSNEAGTSGRPAPPGITEHQFAQLMSSTASSQSRMDEKVAQFQAKVRRGQEEAAAKTVNKAHYEMPYFFLRKGNQGVIKKFLLGVGLLLI